MPNPKITEFNKIHYDKQMAQQRLNEFCEAHPNATEEEIQDQIYTIVASEAFIDSRINIIKKNDPHANSKLYLDTQTELIRQNANNGAYHDVKFFSHFRDPKFEQFLALMQKYADDNTSLKKCDEKTRSLYIDLIRPYEEGPKVHDEHFNKWKGYDKAFFAPETNGDGLYFRQPVDSMMLGDKEKQDYKDNIKKWQDENDAIKIDVPENMNEDLVEFVVMGELFKDSTLLKLGDEFFKTGSSILGEQNIVADVTDNFFSNTIVGDERQNMQMIRSVVPFARTNAKALLDDAPNKRAEIITNIQIAFDTMMGHAIAKADTDTPEFIYPVERMNQLLAACEKAGITTEELDINQRSLANLKLLNTKLALEKKIDEKIQILTKNTPRKFFYENGKTPMDDPATRKDFLDFLAYKCISNTINREMYSLKTSAYEAVPKSQQSRAFSTRMVTYTEKLLLEKPESLFKYYRDVIEKSDLINDLKKEITPYGFFNCCFSVKDMYELSKETILSRNGDPVPPQGRGDFALYEKENINLSFEILENKLADIEKLPNFVHSSEAQIKQQIAAIKVKREENKNLEAEDLFNLMKDDYKQLSDNLETLIARNPLIALNPSGQQFITTAESFGNYPTYKEVFTEGASRVENKINQGIEAIENDPIEKWWDSFRKQIEATGMNPDNPGVLANIMVNNKKEIPLDETGEEYPFMGPDIDKPGIWDELIAKRKELEDSFTYGFMETKDGKYVNPRPETDTVNWMYDNMYSFTSAPKSIKENLYRMAQENRLVLKEPEVTNDFHDLVQVIKVGQDGKAIMTPKLIDMDAQHTDPAQYGFTPEEWEKTRNEIAKAQHIETLYNSANIGLVNYEVEFHIRYINKNRPYPDRFTNKLRTALKQENYKIERLAANFGIRHPEWINTREQRTEYDQAFRCKLLPNEYSLDSEKVYSNKFVESLPHAEKHIKRILKHSGCKTIEEAMKSGRVKTVEGNDLPKNDLKAFTRAYTKAVLGRDNGLMITGKDGISKIYSDNVGLGLQEGTRWPNFEKSFNVIKHGITTKAEKDSPEAKFDEAFNRLISNAAKKHNALANCLEHLEIHFTNVADALKEYKASIGDLNGELTQAQKERLEVAQIVTEIQECWKNADDKVYEKISENHKEFFELNGPKVPEVKTEVKHRDPVDTESYSKEMQRLLKELKKTDSSLSKDTDWYKKVKTTVSNLVDYGFKSTILDTMYATEMKQMMAEANSACKDYMDNHKYLKTLSDRQQRRLKVMHRIMDLTDNATKKIVDPREQRIDKLAAKLTQAQLIANQNNASSFSSASQDLANRSREILLDHDQITQSTEIIKNSNAFKAFVNANKDNIQKVLETNGQKLLKDFRTFSKEYQANRQNPQDQPEEIEIDEPVQHL